MARKKVRSKLEMVLWDNLEAHLLYDYEAISKVGAGNLHN